MYKLNRFALALLSLALAGCAGEQFFEARAIPDVGKPGVHARNVFQPGERVALCVSGPGWYGKTVHIDVTRTSDQKLIYTSKEQTIADGQAHWFGVNVPPGAYRARVFDANEVKYHWDFTMVK